MSGKQKISRELPLGKMVRKHAFRDLAAFVVAEETTHYGWS